MSDHEKIRHPAMKTEWRCQIPEEIRKERRSKVKPEKTQSFRCWPRNRADWTTRRTSLPS